MSSPTDQRPAQPPRIVPHLVRPRRLDQLARATSHVDPQWGPGNVELAWRRLRQERVARRSSQRRRWGAAGAVLVAATALWALMARPSSQRDLSPETAAPTMTASTAAPLMFSDGSIAEPIGPDTELTVVEDSETRTTTSLRRGSGRFRIAHRPSRIFAVRVGDLTVSVLGTEFTVDRRAERVTVTVSRGHVRVSWARGVTDLLEGDTRTFPVRDGDDQGDAAVPSDASSADASTDATPDTNDSPSPTTGRPAARPGSSWWRLAEEGRVQEAYKVLRAPTTPPPRGPDELLAAADVARLAGHPDDAIGFFQRMLASAPGDQRAAAAAFSLGRLLLAADGRAVDAAKRFQQARRLAPAGPLARDALVREAEAWRLAGRIDDARDAAKTYLRLYPQGDRAREISRLGGL